MLAAILNHNDNKLTIHWQLEVFKKEFCLNKTLNTYFVGHLPVVYLGIMQPASWSNGGN